MASPTAIVEVLGSDPEAVELRLRSQQRGQRPADSPRNAMLVLIELFRMLRADRFPGVGAPELRESLRALAHLGPRADEVLAWCALVLGERVKIRFAEWEALERDPALRAAVSSYEGSRKQGPYWKTLRPDPRRFAECVAREVEHFAAGADSSSTSEDGVPLRARRVRFAFADRALHAHFVPGMHFESYFVELEPSPDGPLG